MITRLALLSIAASERQRSCSLLHPLPLLRLLRLPLEPRLQCGAAGLKLLVQLIQLPLDARLLVVQALAGRLILSILSYSSSSSWRIEVSIDCSSSDDDMEAAIYGCCYLDMAGFALAI